MSAVKTKHQCDKCGNYFSAKGGNYKKHVLICDGNYSPFVKRNNCKYCELSFDYLNASERANHTRWCDKNPKKQKYIRILESNRPKEISEEIKKRISEKISKAHKEGKYDHIDRTYWKGKKHSEKTKQVMSQKALQSKHRRLKKGMIEYNGILLDSSWELELAKRLDELQIKWIRPDPMPWVDNKGLTHNYFPDFYLPEYDLYLDPKNPQAVKVQKQKLECISSQYKNVIILRSLNDCKTFLV
jgi:hypothetical protein